MIALLAAALLQDADPRDRCVLVSATASKGQIKLSWPIDLKATGYKVYRKGLSDKEWGAEKADLGADAAGFADEVEPGTAWEYKIVKSGKVQGFGYIYAGNEAPLVDRRGTVILIVDKSLELKAELALLQRDLVGDGWTVLRHDVDRKAKPQEVRALIQADAKADREAKAVFLLGRVPVPYSGNLNPDAHPDHKGAWPADVYYGDVDGEWPDATVNSATAGREENKNVPGDGKFDPSALPSDVELEVGRVDLSQMPAYSKSEKELVQQYLAKDHAFRHKLTTAEARGLICDQFGDFSGECFVGSGWRNFVPLFGAPNVKAGEFLKTLAKESYLWAQGSGAGGYQSCTGVGNTANFAAQETRAVFTILFGSYFGDWDVKDSLLRAPLAGSTYGLTCLWLGRPHGFVHPMGLGETIGYCARLTQNNQSLYQPTGMGARGVHIALMGDPTLRLHVVAPIPKLSVTTDQGKVVLSWKASPDAGAGYHVYRASDEKGPFTRLTSAPSKELTYTDPGAAKGKYTYMVRAVRLETGGSGSYYNASQGVFASPR